jgi:hypothetical protein
MKTYIKNLQENQKQAKLSLPINAQIFNRLDEEVWSCIESFCVPLERLRIIKPLRPTTQPLKLRNVCLLHIF